MVKLSPGSCPEELGTVTDSRERERCLLVNHLEATGIFSEIRKFYTQRPCSHALFT